VRVAPLRFVVQKRNVRIGASLPDIASLQSECRTEAHAERVTSEPIDGDATAAQISETVRYVIHYPLLFLYPEPAQTDLMEDVPEMSTLAELLGTLLPASQSDTTAPFPAWDPDHHFSVDQVALYFQTNWTTPSQQRHWIKVDIKKTLAQILADPAYIVPKFPVFYVFSTATPFAGFYMK